MKKKSNAFLRIEKGQVGGYERGEEIPLSRDVMVIGRPPRRGGTKVENPDIKVGDDYVSRGHAKIYYSYTAKCFVLEERDATSKNGTFINEERIKPVKPYHLKDGDLIGLAKVGGDYRVIFRFRESEATLDGLVEPAKPPTKGLLVDLPARRAWVDGKEVPLRKKEFDLLTFLYQNQGKACSKDEIAKKVWADVGGIVGDETIDQNIHRLREAIEPDPSRPKYVKTLPRFGYRLDL